MLFFGTPPSGKKELWFLPKAGACARSMPSPPCSSQVPPSRIRPPAFSVLLVEVSNALGHAAVPNVTDPGRVALLVAGTAFAPGDDPVQAVKVERGDGTEQRLGADEADGSRDATQLVRAPCVRVRLDPDEGQESQTGTPPVASSPARR